MELLGTVDWSGRIFSGGWVEGGGGTYQSVEPATGRTLGQVGAASAADADRAVELARQAQPSWAATSYSQRAAVLRRAADLLEDHHSEIEDWSMREAGVPRYWAGVGGPAEELRQAASLASYPRGQVLPSIEPRLSFTRRIPVGVVGVIAPFNAPLMLAVRSLAPALAVGNAVVLKPDPRTAICGGVLLARVLEEAGLPSDVLHVLPAGQDIGRHLVGHPDVPVIAFTGSAAAGRAVAELAAPLLKRVHLELGGNSALIVLEDADVEQAAVAGSAGSFMHAGQVCMASSRHLVAAPLVGDYTALLAERASRLPVGNPVDADVAYGPLIDAAARDRVHDIVQDSVEAGARLVTGGTYEDLFYRPTVLTDVPETARAYREEIFGPVAPIVGFGDLEEAARLAAGTEYGLTLSIITKDVMAGLKLAEQVPAGMVHINDQTITDEPIAPFGGMGMSGNGARVGGLQTNLDAFTETQWVTARAQPDGYPF
jgi:benzaldehyde dehydrogenase (NAD)